MTIKTNFLILASALAFAACGAQPSNKKTKNSKESAETGNNSEAATGKKSSVTGEASEELEATGSFALTEEEKEDISGQVEETLQTVVEETGDEGADSGADSLQISAKAKGTLSRNCEERQDGSVLVTVDRSIDRSLEVTSDDASMSRELSRKLHMTRTFAKDGQDIHCHFSKKFVDLLSIQGLDGLSISSDFLRSIDRERKTAAGETYTAHYESAGERSVRFDVDENETSHTLTATISSDVIRKLDGKGPEQEKSLQSRIRTNEEFPLVVKAEIKNNQLFRLPSSVEIASGLIEIDRPNGTRIETQFNNVKVDFGNGICQRRSGTITGKVTRSDGSTQSYKVDFNEKNLVVIFADGSEKKIESVRCAKQ